MNLISNSPDAMRTLGEGGFFKDIGSFVVR